MTLSNLSLVNPQKIAKDPRKLAYLYPRMPASRYKLRTDDFYRCLTLKIAEDVAAAAGCVLIPATCIHYRRRDPARRVRINGHNYYVMPRDCLTRLEKKKYEDACRHADA